MRVIVSIIAFFVVSITAFGQQTDIVFGPAVSGQTFSTCNGFIIDSGGQGGSGYSNGETSIVTICPGTPGDIVSVVFNLFALSTVDDNPLPNVANLDYMDVYDGNSTSAPTLGTYSGNELQGVVIIATVLNTSGCLTFRFRSNSIGTGMFSASASCETPCATPTAAGAIVAGITQDSIRVCVGDPVSFNSNGSFAAPGFNLVDYNWNFMDGSESTGPTATHSFSDPGQYLVQLFVTDDNGCSNTNLVDLQVFVATIPDFTGFPGDTTLCIGESITYTADPESYEVLWDGFPNSNSIQDGCLPDTLLGVSQDVTILQTNFTPGATLTDINDLQSICLELEHSFMGDLVIIVECPNGQSEILHQQGGGGTQIGIPNQLDNVDCNDPSTQGTPFNYCFSPTATETWVEWVDNNGWGGTLPAGTYEPVQPMTNLLGCPLNGVWTLTVIDNWAADDGTLFSFALNLDPSLIPPVTTFEPQIGWGADSSYWEAGAPFVTSLSANADVISITPTAAGTYTYVYHVIDDFGCEHDTSVVITVNNNLLPDAGPDVVVCDGDPVQLNGSINGLAGSSPCDYNLTLVDEFGDGWGGNNVTVTVNGAPTVYVIDPFVTNQVIPISIPNGATVTVTFFDDNTFNSWDCSYTLTDPYGNQLLQNGGNFNPPNTNPFDFTADCFNGYVFNWTTAIGSFDDPNIAGPIGTFNSPGVVTLTTYPNGHPLCATTDQLNVTMSASADPGNDNVLSLCSQGAAQDLFPLLGPTASPNGVWTNPNGGAVTMPYDPVTMNPGAYMYSIDSNGCVSEAIITVTEIVTTVNVAVTNVSCFGAANGSIVAATTNGDSYSLDGGAAQTYAGNTFTINNLAPGTYVLDVTGSNGCADQETFTITEPVQLSIPTISPNITICPGATTALTATGAGGSSAYTFTWLDGATVLGTGVPFNVTPIATTNYCVILSEACGSIPDTACMTVSTPNPITPLVVPDVTSGCFPVPVNFTNMSSGGTVASMIIDYGDGFTETLLGMNGSNHVYENPGVYTVSLIVTSDIGCIYTATFPNMITVFNRPIANFNIQPNMISMFNPFTFLDDGSTTDVVSWDWQIEDGTPSSATTENVNAQFPDGVPGNYEVNLYVTNADGCIDSVMHVVQVVSEVIIYAPNAFTPDGDEFNQTWFVYIDGIDISNFELLIYNRWGEIVFESHDHLAGWDGTYHGKIVPQGTYTWTLSTKDMNNDKKYNYEGSFNVLR
jgi:gliding motility-associated-like protein